MSTPRPWPMKTGNGAAPAPFAPPALPDLGGMVAAMMGDASEARLEAAEAAEWRSAMLGHAERQSVALEAALAVLARLEESLGAFAGGGMGALFGRKPAR